MTKRATDSRLSKTIVRAPLDGYIGKRHGYRAGDENVVSGETVADVVCMCTSNGAEFQGKDGRCGLEIRERVCTYQQKIYGDTKYICGYEKNP